MYTTTNISTIIIKVYLLFSTNKQHVSVKGIRIKLQVAALC